MGGIELSWAVTATGAFKSQNKCGSSWALLQHSLARARPECKSRQMPLLASARSTTGSRPSRGNVALHFYFAGPASSTKRDLVAGQAGQDNIACCHTLVWSKGGKTELTHSTGECV